MVDEWKCTFCPLRPTEFQIFLQPRWTTRGTFWDTNFQISPTILTGQCVGKRLPNCGKYNFSFGRYEFSLPNKVGRYVHLDDFFYAQTFLSWYIFLCTGNNLCPSSFLRRVRTAPRQSDHWAQYVRMSHIKCWKWTKIVWYSTETRTEDSFPMTT